MEYETYMSKQAKPIDDTPTTPAEEKELAAKKFADDIYQCGCGSTVGEKNFGVEKETWVDKEAWTDKESYLGAKKVFKGEKPSMCDDFSIEGKDIYSAKMKPLTGDKVSIGDKWSSCDEKDSKVGYDKLTGKPVAGDKEQFEKPVACDKLGDKVSPEERAAFEREFQRQELLSKKISQALRAGKLGDQETRDAIASNFGILAKNGGREGEQQLLDKMNAGLKADGSEYRLRFGQNIIKTPGGRHLEIVDRSGRALDSMDFVVPDFHRTKESYRTTIQKEINPAKEKSANSNVTKEQTEWNK